LAGAPAVVSTIAMLVDGYDVPPLKRALYRAAIGLSERLSDGFIAESEAIRRVLVEEHGVPEAKVVRIYRGVELDAFTPESGAGLTLKQELGLDPEAPVVGTVGRLVYQKAHEVLLQAAALVVKAAPETQFLIVGEGPLRSSLERRAAELGLKGCRFTGFRSDIPRLLSLMDVFALPSVLEGFPQVLLEALAAARPVVATRIDGVTELVEHGRHGLLVLPRDPVALSDAIALLLKDRGLARQLGETGRRLVEERFSLSLMVEEVDRFYRTLLQETRAPAWTG
jgi:glycosyltransferase involved in cell wall biosynthesis